MLDCTIDTAVNPQLHAGQAGNAAWIGSMSFEVEDLDGSIAESGMGSEFEIDPVTQRLLAAQGMAIVSASLGASRDEEFAALVASLALPQAVHEIGFLFGYCEHVRQEILGAFGDRADGLRLRPELKRRLDTARAMALSQAEG